jgi:hypothetical protein
VAALAAGACGSSEEPVAQVTVSPATATLPYPGTARLEVRWEPGAALGIETTPVVFVHLRSASRAVERTFDHALPFRWQPGQVQSSTVELWQSALAPPLPPGDYVLTLGLYDPLSGRRWPLAAAGAAEVDRSEYAVAQVTVPAPSGAAPKVDFLGEWAVLEPTGDQQLLAQRWLTGDGGLAFGGLAGPVDVDLTLTLLPPEDQGWRQVLDEGAGEAAVIVSSDCGGEQRSFSGAGVHRVALRLTPGPDAAAPCTVTIAPSFVFLDPVTLERRTVALQRLVWNAV